jgi:hypothetical protein
MESPASTWKWPFPCPSPLSPGEQFNVETIIAAERKKETKKERQISEKDLQDLERWRSEYKFELESMF